MPKAEKAKVGAERRHNPVGGEGGRKKASGKDRDEGYLDPALSRRILEQARKQREEEGEGQRKRDVKFDEEEEEEEGGGGEGTFYSDLESSEGEDEYGDDEEEELIVTEEGYVDAQAMNADEEKLIGSFMNSAGFQRRSLADLIMEKIREKEEEEEGGGAEISSDADAEPVSSLPPKVVEVYGKIGAMLRTYTAGKLPKAFKIIPALSNWEEVLMLTNPDDWSAHSMLAATKIFASNMNPKMAQRFYNIFLLERCRSDIYENKRLNYHLYEALRKSVYKPGAYFKGILLPLAASGNCTLREASIFASVLARVSIPSNHSAVALMKLAQLPYNGATSLFVRVLLNKKYALPYKVIDALVTHFMGFVKDERRLPVLWHQSLLVFAQRYREEIKKEDKERLKELLKIHHHHQMTDETRRELFASRSRGEGQPMVIG